MSFARCSTVRALKRFDHLIFEEKSFSIDNPKFNEDRESSGKRAIEAIYNFHSSPTIKDLIKRRKLTYALLLKSIIVNQNKATTLQEKIKSILEFCLSELKTYPNTEFYYVWKFFKHGRSLRFFNHMWQVIEQTPSKVNGMSWDIFSQRYQETMAAKCNTADFFIPFFASFDNRFIELSKASPIRAQLTDEQLGRTITIRTDELEFQKDLNDSMTTELYEELSDVYKKRQRMEAPPSDEKLTKLSKSLEKQLEEFMRSR